MSNNPPIIFRELLIAQRLASEPPAEQAPPAEAEADPYTFDVVASDETVDAYESIVRGWRLARFASNPIVLYAHDSCEPVGWADNVRMEGTALKLTVHLAEAGTSPIVDKVRNLRRQKILRGVSVGFIPNDYEFQTIDGRDVLVLLDNELLEVSICGVPANPNALADVRARALALKQSRAAGATNTRPPVKTPKKPTAANREPEKKPEDPPPPEKDPKKDPPEEDEQKKDADEGDEHAVYVQELGAAVDALEGFSDEQKAAIKSAVDAALASALAKVEAMDAGDGEDGADEGEQMKAARATIAELSKDVGAAKLARRAAEQRAEKAERELVIVEAKRDFQWSPALAPFLATQTIEQLRTWKRTAPKVVPEGDVTPPGGDASNDQQLPVAIADIVARATKDGWSKLPTADRAAVHRHSGKLADRLKAAKA